MSHDKSPETSEFNPFPAFHGVCDVIKDGIDDAPRVLTIEVRIACGDNINEFGSDDGAFVTHLSGFGRSALALIGAITEASVSLDSSGDVFRVGTVASGTGECFFDLAHLATFVLQFLSKCERPALARA